MVYVPTRSGVAFDCLFHWQQSPPEETIDVEYTTLVFVDRLRAIEIISVRSLCSAPVC